MRRVAYVYSDQLIRAADCLPANQGRASLVHSLADSYGLLASSPAGATDRLGESTARIVPPVRATRDQLTRFHDHAFIDAILGNANSEIDSDSESSDSSAEAEEATPTAPSFGLASSERSSPRPRKRRKDESAAPDSEIGLQDDCPVFPELADYVQLVAGASIAAARELRDGRADVAIAWIGGRHHAKRAEAAGFCYVADAVLAIMELRTPTPKTSSPSSPDLDTTPPPLVPPPPPPSRVSRVLYLDLDLHHGDGVESAFFSSPHVLTLSMHLFAPFFFPATGALESTGPKGARAPAAGHALNLALEPGLGEGTFERVWGSCVEKVVEVYEPDAIVVQLGVDGLAGDPCKEWNLPLASFGFALERVLSWNKRTLLLGGGGYHSANAARAWTYLTSVAAVSHFQLGRPLSLEAPIPADLPTTTYELFAPSFTLDVPAGHVSDRNTPETLARVECAFESYAARLAARKKVQQK